MAKKSKDRKAARPGPAKKKPPAPVEPPEPADEDPAAHERAPGPPIVGIGAPAAGLDVFKRFLPAMPADSGIAFVLIPHLDPKHESLMAELLSRHTKMKVVEAAEGAAV